MRVAKRKSGSKDVHNAEGKVELGGTGIGVREGDMRLGDEKVELNGNGSRRVVELDGRRKLAEME